MCAGYLKKTLIFYSYFLTLTANSKQQQWLWLYLSIFLFLCNYIIVTHIYLITIKKKIHVIPALHLINGLHFRNAFQCFLATQYNILLYNICQLLPITHIHIYTIMTDCYLTNCKLVCSLCLEPRDQSADLLISKWPAPQQSYYSL